MADEPRGSRYCRTHAFGSELHAGYAVSRSGRDSWKFLARAWTDLAELKSRNVEHDKVTAALKAQIYSGLNTRP